MDGFMMLSWFVTLYLKVIYFTFFSVISSTCLLQWNLAYSILMLVAATCTCNFHPHPTYVTTVPENALISHKLYCRSLCLAKENQFERPCQSQIYKLGHFGDSVLTRQVLSWSATKAVKAVNYPVYFHCPVGQRTYTLHYGKLYMHLLATGIRLLCSNYTYNWY